MVHDVFLSYGREDIQTMQQVEKTLREAGFTIWTDRGIPPGSPSWKAEIEKAIRATRYVVVLFSPDSAESRWVRAELDYAEAQRKPIYPLLVRGDATNAVPFGFTTYQWIDVRDSARMSSGLQQLVAALKNIEAPLPNVPNRDSLTQAVVSQPRKQFRGFLPLAAVSIIVVLIGGLLLFNSLSQTASPPAATTEAGAAFVPPTALPTMPPFTVPSGFKKLEGEKTMIAVPSNWTSDFDPDVLVDTFVNVVGGNPNAVEMVETMMQNRDMIAVDMLRFQGFFVTIEEIGIPVSYALLETRTKGMLEQTGVDATFINKGLVEMPAGAMLVTEASDGDIFSLNYYLVRGSGIYGISFASRAADTEAVRGIAERVVATFRVKA